jgi:hypothetical protein
MTNVWRLNIKTAAKIGVDPRRFCLDKNILGVGWQVNQSGSVDWEGYIAEARVKYKSRGRSFSVAINALKNRMKIGDLCWTRDHDGTYYLGKITSGWRYENSKENSDADVVNVRNCEWHRVGTVDVVPGKVINSYISGSTVQKVSGENIRRYSQFLANNKMEGDKYELGKSIDNFLSLLSSDDCEDIVALYMQKNHGFMTIPSSCKSDTAAYEYVMKHPVTGRKAVAQVKHGNIDLNRKNYKSLDAEVFLLTTGGTYTGTEALSIHCLEPEKVLQFAKNNFKLMSDRVQNWMRFDADILT